MTLKIITASWYTKLPDTIQRVGICRFAPRGMAAGYRMLGTLKPGVWFNSVPPAEYVDRYYAEIIGALDLQATLRRIEEMQGDKEAVALLCFERPPFSVPGGNWCHRRIAASVLEQELGIEIPEYLAPGQAIGDTVPVGAGKAEWDALVNF